MSRNQNKVFFPNLDGLRFFCFLSVFFYHSFTTNYSYIKESGFYWFLKNFLFRNGNLGVNFFFVLSGFLISYLLFVEKEKNKTISIKNFYIRRVLRIWPLFYFCVFFGFVIFPRLKELFGETPHETARLLYYIFFLNNFDLIKNGLPDSSVLSVLWSVAIEEQFYLVWPILISFIPNKRIKFLLLAIISITFLFRLYYHEVPAILETHTFSCISDMAVGGLFAYLAYYNKKFIEAVQNASINLWRVLYLIVAIIFLFRGQLFHFNPVLIALDRLFISVLFALVIVEQNYAKNSFYKMSNLKFVSQMGTYTYGLYCLHMIGILIAAKGLAFIHFNRHVYQVIFLEGGLSLLITIGLALLSYHFFEKRFLRLKERFALIKTKTVSKVEEAPNLAAEKTL